MAFSSRKIRVCSSPAQFLPRVHEEWVVDERGFATLKREVDSSLPSPDSYDLDKMIKAGVPLQETRTNIIASSDSDILSCLDEEKINE